MEAKTGIKALLLMGGDGVRFGEALPKQFHRLSGKKLYLHTLERFLKIKEFDEIIIVCAKECIGEVKSDLHAYPSQLISVVAGGTTRQESSYCGLCACDPKTEIVVIHDAVRPFVSEEIIRQNIKSARKYKAANTCIACADTIVHSLDGKSIAKIPRRSEYLRGQTPQSFDYALILEAHVAAQKKGRSGATDDCSLVAEIGHEIEIVQGDEHNIKITTPLDFFLAEQLLRSKPHLLEPSHPYSLEGKKIAVTGGTGGIGRAIVQLLEEEGALPIILSPSATEHPLDLTLYSHVESAFQKVSYLHGALDGLVNCAGLLQVEKVAMQSAQEIERLIAVNLTGLVYSCKCALLKKGGHIVNIASSSYSRGRKDFVVYSATKAAIVNFTQGYAEENPDLHINVVVPQRTSTTMRRRSFPDEDPSTLLNPENVASAVVNLLKQQLTGAIIEVKKGP